MPESDRRRRNRKPRITAAALLTIPAYLAVTATVAVFGRWCAPYLAGVMQRQSLGASALHLLAIGATVGVGLLWLWYTTEIAAKYGESFRYASRPTSFRDRVRSVTYIQGAATVPSVPNSERGDEWIGSVLGLVLLSLALVIAFTSLSQGATATVTTQSVTSNQATVRGIANEIKAVTAYDSNAQTAIAGTGGTQTARGATIVTNANGIVSVTKANQTLVIDPKGQNGS
jgi:hypothetical protein